MIIAQILQLKPRQRKTIIPLPSLPAPILSSQAPEQSGAADSRQHIEREADTEARGVFRGLGRNEDVGGDERGTVAAADLERGANDAFIARARIVHVPDHEHRHQDIDACGDGEEAEVASAHGIGLGEFDDPADRG